MESENKNSKNSNSNQNFKDCIENNKLLTDILESSSSVSIIATDLKQNILYWNSGAENIFGFQASEVVGKKRINILYDGTEANRNALLAKELILSTRKGTECELKQKTKSGKKLWSRMKLTPRFDDEGNIIGILGIGVDITQYKDSEHHLRETFKKLKKTLTGIIYATELIIETRDPYTAGHQRRVALLAKAIAENMNLPEQQVEGIYMVGMIHDVGKISIPAEILSMPRRLTPAEYNLIKNHPQAGYDILKNIDFPWPIADIILQHHERIDGAGYPKGLIDKEIMLEAKIIMVADVVEAMASHRPYRAAFGLEKALDEIKQNSDILYDADVVEACINVFEKNNFDFEDEDMFQQPLVDAHVLP